ncbi:MAG: hypothetical protein QM504_10890 [Pseudomonadota bacterium]
MALTLITSPAELSYTRNPINIMVELESDPEFEDVYALCLIYDTLTNLVTTLFARPDSNYRVSFEVSSVLNTLTRFSVPAYIALNETKTNFVIPYWCKIQQYSKGLLVNGVDVGLSGSDLILFAIKGGLAQEKSTLLIFTMLSLKHMFLTWLIEAKVTQAQPYWLYYLHQQADENIIAKAKVYYSDGTNTTTTLNDFGIVSKYNLLKIATGFTQQALGDLQPLKIPIYYEVWMETVTAVLRAGNFTYNLISTYVPYPVYIANANSLGGFDFIVMKGNITTGITPKVTELEHYNASAAKIISFNHTIERNRKAATGHISKHRLQSLTDIFLTDQSYEILNTSYLKIAVSTKTKLEFNETDNLFGMLLEYRRSYINKNFTPDDTN